MEDLCFCILQPEEFWAVYVRVQRLWNSDSPSECLQLAAPLATRERLQLVMPFTSVQFVRLDGRVDAAFGVNFLDSCVKDLRKEIRMQSISAGLDIDITSRVKSLYSTFNKMQKKSIPLEQVYDILAIRVIVREEGDPAVACGVCYRILYLVQKLWKQIPSELDDYIAAPKDSGYQSLHVSVKGPGNVPLEVQIRTASMDERAEYGRAAHWCYKEYEDGIPDGQTVRDAIWGPMTQIEGHPVVRIREGEALDGIVLRTAEGGRQLIVAIRNGPRMARSHGTYTFAVREPYEKFLKYAEEKKWTVPGSGDFEAVVERYVLCHDHAYHLVDHYGHRHPTVVRPVLAFDSDHSLQSHLERLQATRTLSDDDQELNRRISHFRLPLRVRKDLGDQSEFTSVQVLICPEGKMHRYPRGTTAAEVLTSRNCAVDGWARVNGRRVRSDTPLRDGDYVTLENEMGV